MAWLWMLEATEVGECVDRVVKDEQLVSERASDAPTHVCRHDGEPVVRGLGASRIGVLLDVFVGQSSLEIWKLDFQGGEKIQGCPLCAAQPDGGGRSMEGLGDMLEVLVQLSDDGLRVLVPKFIRRFACFHDRLVRVFSGVDERFHLCTKRSKRP